MNETDCIVQKLIGMGWKDNGNSLGSGLFGPDSKFKADISCISCADLYEVRVALALTGRWVNIGSIRIFDSKEKVIKFFKSKKYMTAAYEELLMLLEDNFHSDPSAVELMDKIIDMTMKWFGMENNRMILECPFCHKTPELIKNPAWHGTHGYKGNYFYSIQCKNDNCRIRPKTDEYIDIYEITEEECINKIIQDWNQR